MAESSSKKFQSPKGTRDFYPADLAIRRHIENVWRQTSINHGFDEIDGPTFEHLDLYTHKSGPAIASELFQVFSGKDQEQVAAIRKRARLPHMALRPEFTPTLARMVAAKRGLNCRDRSSGSRFPATFEPRARNAAGCANSSSGMSISSATHSPQAVAEVIAMCR